MLVTIGYILLCVLMFSLAIAIHEFGHFIVALKLGLKVERFSIGFGPAIWRKTWRGVEYRVSWIPLGGYVSIPDVDPEGTKALEGAKEGAKAKGKIPAWKELLVAVAGPAMNIVLAVVLAVVLSFIPSARFGQLSTEIGGFSKGSVSKAAGLRAGDIVVSVAGHPVSTWSELQTEVQITDGKPTVFGIRRPQALTREATVRVVPTLAEDGAIVFGATCETNLCAAVIGGFWPEGASTAEQAGLRVGDRVLSVDGTTVHSDLELLTEIQQAVSASGVTLVVRRGEEELSLAVPLVEAKMPVGDAWLTGWFLGAECEKDLYATTVADVDEAARAAGLAPGDRIVSVAGTATPTWSAVECALAQRAGIATDLVVARAIPPAERVYDDLELTIAPARNEASGALFMQAMSVPHAHGAVAWMPARNPLKQLAWDAGSIFRVLKALVTPKESAGTSKAIGGPVLIAEGIYRSLRHNFADGVGFLRFLNTNLAVMNLLPIPVLDGGLILFSLIALITRRRVPEKVVGVLSTGFMYLLLAAMGYLIFSDSIRSWKIHHVEDPADRIELVIPEGVDAI